MAKRRKATSSSHKDNLSPGGRLPVINPRDWKRLLVVVLTAITVFFALPAPTPETRAEATRLDPTHDPIECPASAKHRAHEWCDVVKCVQGEFWVRGRARLEWQASGPVIRIRNEFESDDLLNGPQGHVVVTAKNAAGQELFRCKTPGAGIGGKSPGKALVREVEPPMECHPDTDVAGQIRSLEVKAVCEGVRQGLDLNKVAEVVKVVLSGKE